MQTTANAETLLDLVIRGKEKPHSFQWLRKNHPALQRENGHIDLSTFYRWATGKGLGGVVLESLKQGGVRVSTTEAVNRFLSRLGGQELTPAIQEQAKDRAAAAQRNKTWVKRRPAAV